MKISFLGTYGAVPSKESGNVSILVDNGVTMALIDVSGNPVQAILNAERNPNDLSLVIITHAHVDHVYALPSLLHAMYCMGRKRELKIVANRPTFEFARSLVDFFGLKENKIGFAIKFSSDERCIIDERIKIEMFPGDHGVPSSMVRVEDTVSRKGFLYTSDTKSIPLVCEAARNIDVMIHETSGNHENIGVLEESGHSSGLQAGVDASCSGVKKLFLCHFGVGNSNSPEIMATEASREFHGKIIVPKPYVWYEL